MTQGDSQASEPVVGVHVQTVFQHQLGAVEIEAMHGGHLAAETLGGEILHQLLNQDRLDGVQLEAIGSHHGEQAAQLGGHELGTVGDLENNHLSADGET